MYKQINFRLFLLFMFALTYILRKTNSSKKLLFMTACKVMRYILNQCSFIYIYYGDTKNMYLQLHIFLKCEFNFMFK